MPGATGSALGIWHFLPDFCHLCPEFPRPILMLLYPFGQLPNVRGSQVPAWRPLCHGWWQRALPLGPGGRSELTKRTGNGRNGRETDELQKVSFSLAFSRGRNGRETDECGRDREMQKKRYACTLEKKKLFLEPPPCVPGGDGISGCGGANGRGISGCGDANVFGDFRVRGRKRTENGRNERTDGAQTGACAPSPHGL